MSVHVQSSDEFEVVTPENSHGVLIVTGNDIPGYDIVQVFGTVYGITVRSRNIGANLGAGFKSLVGGEMKSLTKNVVKSRDQAIDRMVSGARQLGANAIYAFRFDTQTLQESMTEICCYGTACIVRKK